MSIHTKETIELSRQGGIKITYMRFLADSAPGFLFILISIFLYYLYFQGLGSPLENINPHVKIGILILLLLLATPLGLAINAISWMALNRFEQGIAKRLIRVKCGYGFLTGPSRLEFGFSLWHKIFLPNKPGSQNDYCLLYEYSKHYEVLLSVYFPGSLSETSHISGLAQFTRSVAFIAAVLCLFFISASLVVPEVSGLSCKIEHIKKAILLIFVTLSFITGLALIFYLAEILLCSHVGENEQFCSDKKIGRFICYLLAIILLVWIGFCVYTFFSERSIYVHLILVFFLIFLFFLFTAGFLEFYHSTKVLACVHALIDPNFYLEKEDGKARLDEIGKYLLKEGRKKAFSSS